MMTDDESIAGDSCNRLQTLRNQLLSHESALSSGVGSEIENRGGGYHILHFRSGERECVVEAGEELIHAAFVWGNHPLFASQFETAESLATLLRRWVADQAMPSVIHTEYPSLEIDPLADYYERGVPLEGEFMRSWDGIEVFYREDGGDYFESARAFIRDMREAGYDRVLRAGQSMSIMGISRSREQGLRDDQPKLWFEFNGTSMNVDANFGSGGLKNHPILLTPEVRQLLDALAELKLE